jgi:hypothetical protein
MASEALGNKDLNIREAGPRRGWGVNSAGVLTQGKPLAAPLTAAGQRRILTGLSPLPPRLDHLGTDAQPYHRYFSRSQGFLRC